MVKVKYDEKEKKWIELPLYSKEGFYLDGRLKTKLDLIKMIQKNQWDCFFLIDGEEGSGKSTLGNTCAYYLSNTNMTPNNICKSSREAKHKLGTFPDESVLIVDEGDLAFSSKDVFDREQKELIKLTKVIRYKKMVMIIIAPTFFDLNKGIAVRRTRFLLHLYTDKKLKRGRFAYFGKKKKAKLYIEGKKHYDSYAYPPSDFVGSFTNFNPFGESYKEIKDKTVDILLNESDTPSDQSSRRFIKLKYNLYITGQFLKKEYQLKTKDFAKLIGCDKTILLDWKSLPQKYPEVFEEPEPLKPIQMINEKKERKKGVVA